MVYRTVRFSDYSVVFHNDVELIMPNFPSPLDPMEVGTDYNLTGQELLVSLCNLFQEMNKPKNHIDTRRRIIQWCRENVHPYDIDFLYELATSLDPGTVASWQLQEEARFEPEDFIHDLGNLATAYSYGFALSQLRHLGNTKPARELFYEGRLRDGLPFFEQYRSIESDSEYVMAVTADYKEHLIILIDLFPDFRMRLKLDDKTGKIMYGADVKSVFDIAWYSFSRMVADVAPPEDEDLNYMMDSQGKIMSCLCCGKFFVRHSSRQLYCKDSNCQAERNRKNRRATYARQKAEKVQGEAEKAKK